VFLRRGRERRFFSLVRCLRDPRGDPRGASPRSNVGQPDKRDTAGEMPDFSGHVFPSGSQQQLPSLLNRCGIAPAFGRAPCLYVIVLVRKVDVVRANVLLPWPRLFTELPNSLDFYPSSAKRWLGLACVRTHDASSHLVNERNVTVTATFFRA
jgi:hypothetical protein